ncbi:PT domain-containing protein, partial [Terrabacter sp. Root181]|uniref:PT domain-containing protein n=1 Tax=Terrabacter sp. Root181 TaxID=1736484 RepID=UPI000B14A82B
MPFTPSPVELSGAPSGGRWTSVRVAWSTDLDRLARSLDPVLARLRADARAEAATALEELARAGERVLAEIEALEVAKARLEADLLASYGALRTIEAQQIDALPAGAVARVSARVCPDRVVTEEIALATGVGTGEVARRLSLATAPRRHRVVLGALRAGATSLHRALQVASETAQLPDPDVTTVAEAVLAPSRDGRPVPQRTFTARLRRAVASVDARGSQERHAPPGPGAGSSAASHRTGWAVSPSPPTPPPIATVLDRLDTHARGRRGAGDPRTLDQLRADLATHALLHATGHPGPTAGPTAGPTTGPTAGPTAGPTVGDVPAPAPGAASGAVSGGAAALAWIVVPFEVATGESDTACELPGHGWVTAAHAREIITRPGSVWRTLP